MFIVMGATGNVGAAVADELLKRGERVTIVTRHPREAEVWITKGASIAEADAEDASSLRAAFRQGRRAFLLNPPAPPSGNTDKAERQTIANILKALDGCELEKVVAASTYGARAGDALGDLSTLWDLEQGLRSQPVPAAINRGAYYMSNWLGFVDVVLGRAAAKRLLSDPDDDEIWYIEGPARYTPRQVANAFGAELNQHIVVDVAPRAAWEEVFRNAGFSSEAAAAYARMTAVSLDNDFDKPADPVRGSTDLSTFISTALKGSN